MGYLNNSVITIDAILTKKGRELLASGQKGFEITQFALSDDEIDYTLYNPTHPSGSAYYGEAIENMPLLEAFPDENQVMKYKLATFPKGTAVMAVLDLGQSSVNMLQVSKKSITPQTLNYLGAGQTSAETGGYIFTISDVRLFSKFQADSKPSDIQVYGTNVSKTVTGNTLNLQATGVNTLFGSRTTLQTTLIVTGVDSGTRLQIPVTIRRSPLYNDGGNETN
jgi:hypothetical protein